MSYCLRATCISQTPLVQLWDTHQLGFLVLKVAWDQNQLLRPCNQTVCPSIRQQRDIHGRDTTVPSLGNSLTSVVVEPERCASVTSRLYAIEEHTLPCLGCIEHKVLGC